ncbi:MAG: restriction endonuclease subunit S [Gammaproteobacteria bacterium]
MDEVTEPKIDQAGPPPTGEFTYVDISSVDNSAKHIVEPKRLPADSAPSRARQRLRSGDVLVSMTRPNLNAVALVPPELDGAIGSTGFHVLRARDNVLPQWLYYGVQTRQFVGAMSELVQGALYPAVRPKDIRAFDLPVPALDEQRRIVAELEKQFSRLDEAVANLKRVKDKLKRYKAAVLQAAVEGRLVPTEAELASCVGRKYETGEALLVRALQQRQTTWNDRSKYKEPVGADQQLLPTLPEGWVWATVDELTSLVTSGSRGWGEFYSDRGVLFIRAQEIKTDSLVLADVARVKVPEGAEGTRASVDAGDVLVTITGANVTKSARVIALDERAYVSQHVALLKFVMRDLSPFAFLWIISPANGRKTLERWAYGAGKPGLSLEQVRALPIALPPLIEQHRIVAEVDRRRSIVREVEVEVAANLKRAQALRQAVLATAFGKTETSLVAEIS